MRIEDAAMKAANEGELSDPSEEKREEKYVQWDLNDDDVYTPLGKLNLRKALAPGYYLPYRDMRGGLHLQSVDTRLDGLVDFNRGIPKKINDEINLFWNAEKRFREINKTVKVIYKRGILMYGPPGCGKSSMISVVMRDIVRNNGVALYYTSSDIISESVKVIRMMQPDIKIMVVMEDIDDIISNRGEADILNMLDGVDTTLDRIVFLATSNHIHRISNRMLRPSRFDMKVALDYPDSDMRKKYLEDLLKANGTTKSLNLKRAIADTDGFSFADLKELFISTCVFGYEYVGCIDGLRNSLHTEERRESDPLRELSAHMKTLSLAMSKKKAIYASPKAVEVKSAVRKPR